MIRWIALLPTCAALAQCCLPEDAPRSVRTKKPESHAALAFTKVSPLPAKHPVLPREPSKEEARRSARRKMEELIIPVIDFEDTSVEEATDFLRLRSREIGSKEDTARKGVAFVIRKPRAPRIDDAALDADAAGGLGAVADPGGVRINLRMRNVTLWDACQRLAQEAHLKVEIGDDGIVRFRE